MPKAPMTAAVTIPTHRLLLLFIRNGSCIVIDAKRTARLEHTARTTSAGTTLWSFKRPEARSSSHIPRLAAARTTAQLVRYGDWSRQPPGPTYPSTTLADTDLGGVA